MKLKNKLKCIFVFRILPSCILECLCKAPLSPKLRWQIEQMNTSIFVWRFRCSFKMDLRLKRLSQYWHFRHFKKLLQFFALCDCSLDFCLNTLPQSLQLKVADLNCDSGFGPCLALLHFVFKCNFWCFLKTIWLRNCLSQSVQL